MMICRLGKSPGFFSENNSWDKAGNGFGKEVRRADLPTSDVERAFIHRSSSYSI